MSKKLKERAIKTAIQFLIKNKEDITEDQWKILDGKLTKL